MFCVMSEIDIPGFVQPSNSSTLTSTWSSLTSVSISTTTRSSWSMHHTIPINTLYNKCERFLRERKRVKDNTCMQNNDPNIFWDLNFACTNSLINVTSKNTSFQITIRRYTFQDILFSYNIFRQRAQPYTFIFLSWLKIQKFWLINVFYQYLIHYYMWKKIY